MCICMRRDGRQNQTYEAEAASQLRLLSIFGELTLAPILTLGQYLDQVQIQPQYLDVRHQVKQGRDKVGIVCAIPNGRLLHFLNYSSVQSPVGRESTDNNNKLVASASPRMKMRRGNEECIFSGYEAGANLK